MTILVTAFDRYGPWEENSSWLALMEYLHRYGASGDVITRRYPVRLDLLLPRLETDLARGCDGVLHLGQRPGGRAVHLEAFALNVAGSTQAAGAEFPPLIEHGTPAFQTRCPLGLWTQRLAAQAIPAEVSYHAGTYLCNAIYYLTEHWLASRGLSLPVLFVHLPLASEQAAADQPALPKATLAAAVGELIEAMRSLTVASTTDLSV